MKAHCKSHWLKDYLNAALDYLYPPIHNCPGCGAEDIPIEDQPTSLCPPCHATFPWVEPRDLPRDVSAVAHYEGGARTLVSHLKYREGQYLAPVMAKLMAAALEEQGCLNPDRIHRESISAIPALPASAPTASTIQISPWLVIPVPLHPARQKERGYNQSQLLASQLAHVLEFSYIPHALSRQKKTAPLHRLSRQQRAATLADSMVLGEEHHQQIRHRHILLVDDIYTTGATANACREALQQAAPASITLAAFALADLMTLRGGHSHVP